jgi:NAD(P)-dependent dehydrogenase (short-subunit alcohol dehydrogenase family)
MLVPRSSSGLSVAPRCSPGAASDAHERLNGRVAGTSASQGGLPFTDYTADDYALVTGVNVGGFFWLTQLAIEYASHGIRVNAVAPGVIQTPMHSAEGLAALRMPPLGHIGQVSDVVDAILYLESAPFVTGEILYVDGGYSAGH